MTGGLLLLGVLLYFLLLPALKAPFAFDDSLHYKQIGGFETWTECLTRDAFGLFRPVKNLYFYILYQFDASVFAFHVGTFVAYYLATVGVFTLSRRLTASWRWGLATATIWSLSAAHVSIAIWPSAVNIACGAAAMAFGLACWDHWRETPGRHLSGAGFFGLLVVALCSYETTISMAPIAVILDLFRGRRIFTKNSIFRYIGIAAVVLAYLVIRHMEGAVSTSATNPAFLKGIEDWQISVSAPYFLWTHFLMWLAPWGRLEFFGSYLWDRSIPAVIIPFCWLFLIGLSVLCVRFWKAGQLFIVGLAWFFLASFPSGNFVPIGNTPYADYYVPIPAIGLALSFTALLRGLARIYCKPGNPSSTRRTAIAAIVVLVGARAANVVAFRSWAESWQNPAVMLARTAAARPYQFLAKSSLAGMLLQNGEYELAEDIAGDAMRDTDEISQPYLILADVHYHREEYEEALELLQIARQKQHLNPEAPFRIQYLLGKIIGRDPEQSDLAFRELLPLLRNEDSYYHRSGVVAAVEVFARSGETEKQRIQLERGLEIYPDDPQLLATLNALDEAEESGSEEGSMDPAPEHDE